MVIEKIKLSKVITLTVESSDDAIEVPGSAGMDLVIYKRPDGLHGLLNRLGLYRDDRIATYHAKERLIIYDASVTGDKEVTLAIVDEEIIFIDNNTGGKLSRELPWRDRVDELWMVRRRSGFMVFRPMGQAYLHGVLWTEVMGSVESVSYMPLLSDQGTLIRDDQTAIFPLTAGKYNLVRWRTEKGLRFELFGDFTGFEERAMMRTNYTDRSLKNYPKAKTAQLFRMDDYAAYEWRV